MNQLSIIIPVYNNESSIRNTIESIMDNRINIIVINDGSKDNTANIVKELMSKYSNIFYYEKNNEGVSEARNYGISKVTTKYFSFLDSDDIGHSNTYLKMVDELEKSNNNICFSNFRWIYKDSNKIQKDINYLNKEDLLCHMFTVLWNKVYRTEYYKSLNINFIKGYVYEDVSMLYKYIKDIKDVSYVDDISVNYIQKEGTISRSYDIRINDMIVIFNDLNKYYNNEYKEELEYIFIRYFLGSSYLRTIRIKDNKLRKETLSKAYNYLINNYPNYKNNKYLINSNNIKDKYYKLENEFMYYNLDWLFRLLFKLKILK